MFVCFRWLYPRFTDLRSLRSLSSQNVEILPIFIEIFVLFVKTCPVSIFHVYFPHFASVCSSTCNHANYPWIWLKLSISNRVQSTYNNFVESPNGNFRMKSRHSQMLKVPTDFMEILSVSTMWNSAGGASHSEIDPTVPRGLLTAYQPSVENPSKPLLARR